MAPLKSQPSIEELEAMTLEERARLQQERIIPLDQLSPERVARIRERALRHIAAREEAATR